LSPTKIAGGLAAAVTVAGGVVALVYTFEPSLSPCFGSSVDFVSAPVFPGVPFRDHMIREGETFAAAAKEANPVGAEVRFDFVTAGFRGKELPVTWSLFRVDDHGSLSEVVPGQDRAAAMTIKPHSCSEHGGYDLWIPIPESNRRYRVLLELYRDKSLTERAGLIETETFHS
jgi:hypothetical protein